MYTSIIGDSFAGKSGFRNVLGEPGVLAIGRRARQRLLGLGDTCGTHRVDQHDLSQHTIDLVELYRNMACINSRRLRK